MDTLGNVNANFSNLLWVENPNDASFLKYVVLREALDSLLVTRMEKGSCVNANKSTPILNLLVVRLTKMLKLDYFSNLIFLQPHHASQLI